MTFGCAKGRLRGALPARIHEAAGAVWATDGRIRAAFAFSIKRHPLTGIDIIMDRAPVADLDLKVD